MTELAELTIGIDARPAIRGGKQVERALEGVQRESRQTTAVMQKRFSAMSGFFLKLSGGLAALGGAALFGASVFREIDDFSFALSNLSSITGATGDDLDFLKERALELGRTTIFSGQQALDGFALIASAKPDLLENAAALAEVTENALTLAQAAGTDLPQAAEILGSSLNQFNAGAEQAERFINVLAAGSKFGSSFIIDTAAALKEAGTVAASAGISFEETSAAIQVLAEKAIRGSQAGTNLRNVFTILQTGADKFNPAVVGLQTALENLGAENLTTAEKVKLFGRENLVAGDILIQGADALASYTEKLTGTNTALEQAETKYDNLRGDILALKSAWSGFLTDIGDSQQSWLRSVIQTLTDVINGYKEASVRVQLFWNDLEDIANRASLVFGAIGAAIETAWDTLFNNLKRDFADYLNFVADAIDTASFGVADETVAAIRAFSAGIEESKVEVVDFGDKLVALNIEYKKNQQTILEEAAALDEQLAALQENKEQLDLTTSGVKDNTKVITEQAAATKKASEETEEMTGHLEEWQRILERGKDLTNSVRTAQEIYNDEIAEYNDLLDRGVISTETFGKLTEQAYNKVLEGTNTMAAGAERAFNKYKEDVNNVGAQVESAMTNTFQAAEDALTEFFTTGKLDVKSFADTVIAEFARMQAKKLMAMAFEGIGGGQGSSSGDGGGGLFGMLSGFASSIFGGFGGSAATAHTGGIVGTSPMSTRSVAPGTFSNARRFHNGGTIGSDEVPIIARRGERIQTPEQMRMEKQQNKMVTNNVYNQITLSLPGVTDSESFERNKPQMGELMQQGLNEAQRNM